MAKKATSEENAVLAQEAAIDQAVATAAEKYGKMNKALMLTYWEFGELVNQLDTKYGSSAIKQFASKLSIQIGRPDEFHEASLYRCRQFYLQYDVAKRDKLISANVSWTQLTRLLPCDVKEVDVAIDRVLAGEVAPTQIADVVRGAEAQKKEPGGAVGGKRDIGEIADDDEDSDEEPKSKKSKKEASDALVSAADFPKLLKDCITLVDNSIDAMGSLIILADSYGKLSGGDRDKYAEKWEELVHFTSELHKSVASALKRAKDVQ